MQAYNASTVYLRSESIYFKMRKYANGIWFSFPVQLLVLHVKRSHFLLLSWVLIICFITGNAGSRYGINLLFLDPEYLGRVDFLSFFILGFAFGGFFIVWNLTSYILHAKYFSFLATLNRPFATYCLNNAIVPLLFFIMYDYKIIAFQSTEGLLNIGVIALRTGGLLCGMFVFISVSMLYFFRSHKSIGQFAGKESTLTPADDFTHEHTKQKQDIDVEYYFNHSVQLKLARSADHYPKSIIHSVYRQHHSNALFIELASLLLIILLSFLIDYKVFRIPTGTSILLMLTIFIMLFGAFTYWLGRWKIFFFVLLIVLVNYLMKADLLQYENKAYGLSYAEKTEYTTERLMQLADSSYTEKDKLATQHILENWKQKFESEKGKPKMVFLNCSGGGLRATMFVMKVLQEADSLTQHKLMQHSVLITGASGGMIAAAYYRELYLQKLQGGPSDISNTVYLQNISGDLLNAVGFTLVVNDLFYPWQSFRIGDTKHRKDRGYMFEKILNENTGNVLSKPLAAYKQPEANAEIPMMLFYPTILNDERKLFAGSQSFSYMSIAPERLHHFSKPEIDGVDLHALFSQNNADSLSFTSLLRMNCTFPYILPNVHLPTEPDIEVMDAGVRDNYGIQASAKFIEEFSHWINTNTSGVVMVNIRGIEQEMKIQKDVTQGVFEKIFSPIGTLYNNWVEIQDYQNENIMNTLSSLLDVEYEVLTFEYQPAQHDERASLSFHLTAKEKMDIVQSATSVYNEAVYLRLAQLLTEK